MISKTLRPLVGIGLFVLVVSACGSNRDQSVGSSAPGHEDSTSPAAKLNEARSSHSATAYRAFLHDFPNAPEAETARRELAGMYDEALAEFIRRAPEGRPQLIQFVTKLTETLKATASSSMEIRYREKEVPGEYALYSFTPSSRTREKVLSSLRNGFAAFPVAILEITEGEDVSGPEALKDIGKPTIYIEYKEQMNNTEFGARGQKDPVFGYDVSLKLSLRNPNASDKFEFSVAGRTPGHFNANNDNVYEMVVDLAVDQFLDKIEKTFTNGNR